MGQCRKKIRKIFEDSNIQINIFSLPENNISNVSGSDKNTVHSDPENLVNGTKYINDRLNIAKNQIIFELHDYETEIKIQKILNHQKQRLICKFNKENFKENIFSFLKECIVPKIRFLYYSKTKT